MTARFSVADGERRLQVTKTNGESTDYTIHSVVGVEPLQQYLIETAPGRLQSFDVVWDTERQHCFHLYPDQKLPPDDALHWTGPYKNWNSRCTECHATGYAKNYNHEARTYASTQVEIGMGCEACHGPGGARVEYARTADDAPGSWPPAGGFPADLSDSAAAIEQCAGCHSCRESYLDGRSVSGTPFHDACTGCHEDRDADWAAARLVECYPDGLNRGPRYGTILARACKNPAEAAEALVELALDDAQPGIVRATALDLLRGAGDAEPAERVAPLFEDADPLVRAAAVDAQRASSGQQQALRVVGLLDDPVRSVRMAAATDRIEAAARVLEEALRANPSIPC